MATGQVLRHADQLNWAQVIYSAFSITMYYNLVARFTPQINRKMSIRRAIWMDGLCFIRTLLQRPFQQEFRGALGTRSTIINYGKEKRCALPAGTTCQSQSEWKKPAEVHGARGGSQKQIQKGEGAEQEGDGKKHRTERKGKQKEKRKNEPVQETGNQVVPAGSAHLFSFP